MARNPTCSCNGFRTSQVTTNVSSVPPAIARLGTKANCVSLRVNGLTTGRPVEVFGPIVSGS